MKILDFLCSDAIAINLESETKKDAIKELVDYLVKAKKIKNEEKAIQALLEREKLGTTGIGQGVAIPHCKSDNVSDIVAAFGISKKGVEFDSLDGEPVYIISLLIAPTEAAGAHLKALAKISRLLKDKFFRQALRDAESVDAVIKIIREEDNY
ncbi:MAG: PTS sugar transporter subunit IIA [Elusimicrobiota bacterium]